MSFAHANDKTRTLIVWEVSAVGSPAFVEMYVNPSSLDIKENKIINETKTKGGFIIQYWGENLTTLSIRGQTGSGGIEALNVVRDIYRSEQLALQNILQSRGRSSKRRQSLAQLAASVTMWYQGQGHRGFFKSFSYTETAENLGIFEYSMEFTITETIGQRKNFLPWQRKPWSTIDNPSFDTGRGTTTGGAYNTNFKMGEMSAPVVDTSSGVLRDPQFTSETGNTILPGTSEARTLQNNLKENQSPLNPANLFANT